MIKGRGRGRTESWSETPAGGFFGGNGVVVLVVMVVVLVLLASARRNAFDSRAKSQFFLDLRDDCRLPVVRSRFWVLMVKG